MRKEGASVHLFDANGREKKHGCAARRMTKGWEVKIDLEDWEEIAVIE